MIYFGRDNLNTLFENRVIYRNLIPGDPALPNLKELRQQLHIPANTIPRKATWDYARVVHTIIQIAQKNRGLPPLERVIMIGDTRMNDGTAMTNIAELAGWPGIAFIGSDQDSPAVIHQETVNHCHLFTANRWKTLKSFDQILQAQIFPVDDRTVVIVDIDKTALAARGRNHRTIDAARLEAAKTTAETALQDAINLHQFESDYRQLNQPEFHPLTMDNQDVLVYLCLVLNTGWTEIISLQEAFQNKQTVGFDGLLENVEESKHRLPAGARGMHERFRDVYLSGDPTPFKAFRYAEYLATSRRMGSHPDNTPIETLLHEEILLTAEVFHAAQTWAGNGAMIFGLSDKPDEATNPQPDLAAKGMKPIHQIETHLIGE